MISYEFTYTLVFKRLSIPVKNNSKGRIYHNKHKIDK